MEIWTSTFTLAEVFKKQCEGRGVSLPESQDVAFEKYIAQNFLVLVQVDFEIGVEARRLLRKYPELKKPPDAVHLASALANNVDEMHTFDAENLIPLSGKIARSDGEPLTICLPPMPELTIYPDES